MNRKQLVLLIVLVAVVGGLATLVSQKRKSTWDASAAGGAGKVLPDFALNEVAAIRIRKDETEVNLVRKDDLWRVAERGDYPANFDEISSFLRKVWELKPVQQVKVGASHLGRLELAEPGQGSGSGTAVEFQNQEGKAMQTLLLGKKEMRETGNDSPFGGGGGWPAGRYVMVANQPDSVSLVSEPFSNVEAKPEQWLNRDFFKVEKIKSITAKPADQPEHGWTVARETESGEWQLAEAKPEESLDSSKVSAFNHLLSSPSFTDVAPPDLKPEDLGLDQPFTATIETFDQFTYTVKIGKKTDDNLPLQVAVSASLARERTPGEGESEEDKARLDKEFADKAKTLQEKLEQEKAFEKWTYLVSEWTVQQLMKERKDLLAEKKEEEPEKAETSPEPAPPQVELPPLPPLPNE